MNNTHWRKVDDDILVLRFFFSSRNQVHLPVSVKVFFCGLERRNVWLTVNFLIKAKYIWALFDCFEVVVWFITRQVKHCVLCVAYFVLAFQTWALMARLLQLSSHLVFPLQRERTQALMEKLLSRCLFKTLMIPASKPISGTSKDQLA